jgi:lysophospholipase L1-like esterase
MTAITSTGTLIYIAVGAPPTFDYTGYTSLSYDAIGEVTNIPQFGPSVQVVEHNPLSTGITQKFKGFINYGSVSIEAAYDPSDVGQIASSVAVTGAEKNTIHSFKLEYQDGSVKYWAGKVFSYTQNPSSANSMVSTSILIEINTVILSVSSRGAATDNRVAVIGTSLVNQCEYGANEVAARSQQGWLTWLMAYEERVDCPIWYDSTVLIGWEPSAVPGATRYFQGLNMGVSGQTAQQIYDRRFDIAQMNADIYILDMGTNDIGTSTPAQIHALRLAMVEFLETLNPRYIVVLPILSRGAAQWVGGGSQWNDANEVNLLTQNEIGIREKVRIYNWNDRWSDQDSIYNYPRAGASVDDIHFDGRGARWVGEHMANWIKPLLTDVLPEAPREDLLPNDLTGVGGTVNAPVTGVTSTDFEISRTSGDCTVVASKDGSDNPVITITPLGTSGTSVIQFRTDVATTLHAKADLWAQAGLSLDVQTPECVVNLNMYLREYTGGTGGVEVGNGRLRAATNYTEDSFTTKIRSSYINFATLSDGFRWRVDIEVDNTSTTPVIITLSDAWVSEMNDPIEKYGEIVQ